MIGMQSKKEFGLPSLRPYDNTAIPFSPLHMRLPKPMQDAEVEGWKTVYVKRSDRLSEVVYAFSPFLCVAWNGAPYPFAIHASQLNFASVSSIHPDPSNFVVFSTPDGEAMVSFLGPRHVHSLPYNHKGKWDEVLFMAKPYDARKGSAGGVGDGGTMTLHPQGIWHGPQMEALEKWKRPSSPKEHPWAEDSAVMFETKAPLELCKQAIPILIPGYENSWLESWEEYEKRREDCDNGTGAM
jgi:homogentisate 1,2-dioxygenase